MRRDGNPVRREAAPDEGDLSAASLPVVTQLLAAGWDDVHKPLPQGHKEEGVETGLVPATPAKGHTDSTARRPFRGAVLCCFRMHEPCGSGWRYLREKQLGRLRVIQLFNGRNRPQIGSFVFDQNSSAGIRTDQQ